MSQSKIRIHCFEPNGVEGCPSNTYEAEDIESVLGCIKDLLGNRNSGISRILIENPMFSDSDCYGDIVAMSPMNVDGSDKETVMEGNQMKMREALEMFVSHASCLYHCDIHRLYPETTSCNGILADGEKCSMKPECDAVFRGRAALSEPPRNCDIYHTKEDVLKEWSEYMRSHAMPRGGWDFRHIINWLYAKAEEGARNEQH